MQLLRLLLKHGILRTAAHVMLRELQVQAVPNGNLPVIAAVMQPFKRALVERLMFWTRATEAVGQRIDRRPGR